MEKVRERYKRKAEKERKKIEDVYVTVLGEKCYTEEAIMDFYASDQITCAQCDRYLERLEKKEETAEAACVPDARDNTVVVISSDKMGEGEEELGKVLIKGYIYALTQLETLPKTILFYNKGAYLTCEGSASLEDLKSLEAQGVEILTCGTCLNYYGITEKLQVGTVTNMYVIAETMAKAGKVVKP